MQSTRQSRVLFVFNVPNIGKEVWIGASDHGGFHIVGIDRAGKARPLSTALMLDDSTALATHGILTESDGWLWLADERIVIKLRPLWDSDSCAPI